MYAILHIPTGSYLKKRTIGAFVDEIYVDSTFEIFIVSDKEEARKEAEYFILNPRNSLLWTGEEINDFYLNKVLTSTKNYKYLREEFEVVEVT